MARRRRGEGAGGKARAGLRTCCACAVLASLLIALFVGTCWDALRSQLCLWRLGWSADFAEAASRMRALEAHAAGRPEVSETIVEGLGATSPRRTFWFFALLDEGEVKDALLVDRFRRALDEREDLSLCWSHFIGWRLGARGPGGIRWRLAADGPGGSVGQAGGASPDPAARQYWLVAAGRHPAVDALRARAIPGAAGAPEVRAPGAWGFDTYNAGFYAVVSWDLPYPSDPLPGWEGPVPDLPRRHTSAPWMAPRRGPALHRAPAAVPGPSTASSTTVSGRRPPRGGSTSRAAPAAP